MIILDVFRCVSPGVQINSFVALNSNFVVAT